MLLIHIAGKVVRAAGVEPTTFGFGGRRSIQLSYARRLLYRIKLPQIHAVSEHPVHITPFSNGRASKSAPRALGCCANPLFQTRLATSKKGLPELLNSGSLTYDEDISDQFTLKAGIGRDRTSGCSSLCP